MPKSKRLPASRKFSLYNSELIADGLRKQWFSDLYFYCMTIVRLPAHRAKVKPVLFFSWQIFWVT